MIAKNLETLRTLWGFTIEEMSKLFTGVSASAYRSYETGRRGVHVEMMCELEDLTKIPVIRLYRETLHMKELPDKPMRKKSYAAR